MSDTETEPEALEDDAPAMQNPPEILVFGMSGGLLGAVINRQLDAGGSNIADRAQTQLVMAPTQLDLEARCKSTLIAQYGLTQEEADSLIPGAMTPLATLDGGGYVSSAGGTVTGPLILAGTPAAQIGTPADFVLTYTAPNRVLQWAADHSYHYDELTGKHWWVNQSGPLMSLEDTGDLGVNNNVDVGGYITQEAGPPTDPLHCATKQYTDDAVAALDVRVAALEALVT